MQPSTTKPPMSGDETANPLATTLPPLSPELPQREQEPTPPITETPPKDKAKAAGILLPKALVDDLYREARKNFALIPDMTFALAAGSRTLRDMWDHKDGKFLRKERPFANYIPPKDEANGATLRDKTAEPASAESAAVAAARARWDEAKKSGDPDRMTRTANELLRAVEASDAPTSPQLRAPVPNPDAEHVSTPESQVGADRGPTLGERAAQEPVGPDAIFGATPSAAPEDYDAQRDDDLETHERAPARLSNESSSPTSPTLAGSTLRDGDLAQVGHVPLDEPQIQLVPTDPRTGGMLRLERVRRRWVQPRPQYPGQSVPGLPRFVDPSNDTADPSYGWDSKDVLEVLKEQANQRDLTPELLQMLSNQIYEWDGADFDPERIRRKLAGTWEVVAVSRPSDSGYQAVALYHRGSNSVVIVNRGTEFAKLDPTDPGSARTAEALRDLTTDREIFWKRNSAQLSEAQTFLFVALNAAKKYSRSAQFVLTGHSLGGALAQAQLAAAYEVTGLDVVGVTFAALGAREAIRALPKRRAIDFFRLLSFADARLVNYVRAGDGLVERSAVGPQRPRVLGRTVVLKGIAMPSIESEEGWADRGNLFSLYNLFLKYQENHDLRSFYHRDFTLPLRGVFRRRDRPI